MVRDGLDGCLKGRSEDIVLCRTRLVLFRICRAKAAGESWHWFDLVLSRWLSDRVEVYQQKRLEINHELSGREKGAMRERRAKKRESFALIKGTICDRYSAIERISK